MEVDVGFAVHTDSERQAGPEGAVPDAKDEKQRKKRLKMERILAMAQGEPKIKPFVNIDLARKEKHDETNAWYSSKFRGHVPSKTQKKSPTMTVSGRSGFKELQRLKQKMSESIEKHTLENLEKRRQLFKEDNPEAEAKEESDEEPEELRPKKKSMAEYNSDEDSDYEEGKAGFEESGSDGDDEEEEEAERDVEDEEEGEPMAAEKGKEDLESDDEEEPVHKQVRRIVLSDDEDESIDAPSGSVTLTEKQPIDFSQEMSPEPSSSLFSEEFKIPELPKKQTQSHDESYEMLSFSQFKPTQEEEQSAEKNAVDALGLHTEDIDEDELAMLCSGAFATPAPNVLPPPKESIEVDVEENSLGVEENSISGDSDRVHSPVTAAPVKETVNSSQAPKLKKIPKLKFDSDSDSDDDEEVVESTEIEAPKARKSAEKDEVAMLLDEEARDGFEEPDPVEENNAEEDSDDEVAEYNKIFKKSNFFDDEASLSGDDVGSDEDSDGAENDEYEVELGDEDDVPDSVELRADLHKQFMKQQQDDEERRLLYLQDKFFVEGELHTSTDRNFRFKLREEQDAKVAEEEGDKENAEDEGDAEDEENEAEAEESQKRAEKAAWLMSKQKEETFTTNAIFGFGEEEPGGSLFQVGSLALSKKVGQSELASRTYSGGHRDSMLQNSDSLSLIVKDTNSTSNIAPHSLFTVMPSVGRNAKRPFAGTTVTEKASKRAPGANIFASFDS